MTQMTIDWSTINMEKLETLKRFPSSSKYHLSTSMGSGCFLDPPGYPSYFIKSVYTRNGNSPNNGPYNTIRKYIIDDVCLKQLWIKLPLDHPRTRAWIEELYRYFHHCYQDGSKNKAEDLIIYPVPAYKLKTFYDDERFSDEWRSKEKASIEQANKEILDSVKKIAIPENHRAVRYIQEHYPEYKPEQNLIDNPPKHPGNWWEIYSKKLTPEECPGQYGKTHPVNGSWCQMCGWRKEHDESV